MDIEYRTHGRSVSPLAAWRWTPPTGGGMLGSLGAMRAERLAIIRGEADALEGVEGLLVRQPQNLSDAQAPCGWRIEEVCHGPLPSMALLM